MTSETADGPQHLKGLRPDYAVEFEPRLVEEVTLLAADRSSPEIHKRFRSERDSLYEMPPGDEREAAFHKLHSRWFVTWKLHEPVWALLGEYPILASSTRACFVLAAGSSRDEGADIHGGKDPDLGPKPPRPLLVIRLRLKTLLDAEATTRLLRTELMHAADMLDPGFAYDPRSPEVDGNPFHASLTLQRYRTLWKTTIHGRLAARGLLAPATEDRLRREFRATFPMLGAEADESFHRFFHGNRPTHGDLLRFAGNPAAGAGGGTSASHSGQCPLCGFPTVRFHPSPQDLDDVVIVQIRRDRPEWSPTDGLCLQCADLYDSRGEPAPAPTSSVPV